MITCSLLFTIKSIPYHIIGLTKSQDWPHFIQVQERICIVDSSLYTWGKFLAQSKLCDKIMENITKESYALSKVLGWATFIAIPGCM